MRAERISDPAAEWVPLDKLRPWVKNPRRNDHAVERLANLIQRFGFGPTITARRENYELIGGHTRVKACLVLVRRWADATAEQRERWQCPDTPKDERWHPGAVSVATDKLVPVRLLDHDEAEAHLMAVADNKSAEWAEWDEPGVADVLGAYDFQDAALAGFTEDELARLDPSGGGDDGRELEQDEVPEPPKVPVSKLGDIWVLGRHRVICGDCTSKEDIARLMAGEVARLLHADPPYGMGKEGDGVLNDNLYAAKLDQFQMAWWRTCRPHVSDKGSAYLWGNAEDLWRLWFVGGLRDSERLELRNEIVWNKVSIAGMASPLLTQFPVASERCLFFQFGAQFLGNVNAEDYWSGWDEVRLPLVEMAAKAALSAKRVREICGVGMYAHWFTKSQWSFIPKQHYRKLQQAFPDAFDVEYTELRKSYERLLGAARSHFNALQDGIRSYFDNAHDVMTDVWDFPRVFGEERHGHATPKPVAMMARVLRSSCPEGGLTLEPFGGSGSTLIAAEQTGRRCFTAELSPGYCDVIVERWQNLTGEKATRARL